MKVKLSLQEIISHKFTSCLFIGIMVIGLFSGFMSADTIDTYIEISQQLEKNKNYDYILDNSILIIMMDNYLSLVMCLLLVNKLIINTFKKIIVKKYYLM